VSERATPRLQLLAAAALFSTGGAAIKATAFDGWQTASFRSGIAAAAVLLLLPAARRGWNRRVLLVGVAYAATMILFVLANRLTTAANTIFLQSTAPLYILLFGPWLLREPVRRRDLGFMAVVALGMVFFFVGAEAPVATAPDPFRGNLLAAASGVTWAGTVMGLRWLGRTGKGDEAVATVAVGNLLACVIALPLALPVARVGAGDVAIVLYLGVFQIGLAYFFVTRAMRRVGALEAAVILLAEPALNPVWAWLAHGETPGRWALLGGGVILGATLLKTWWDGRAGIAAAADRGGAALPP
jgi:drug/metabolite transporter (DMT)-like permease